LPIEARDDDTGIINAGMDLQKVVQPWLEFYQDAFYATLYCVLNLHKNPNACDSLVFAVHIHRRKDSFQQKSVAFAFDIVTGETVRNSELARWVLR
jgi:hypothetical protein